MKKFLETKFYDDPNNPSKSFEQKQIFERFKEETKGDDAIWTLDNRLRGLHLYIHWLEKKFLEKK